MLHRILKVNTFSIRAITHFDKFNSASARDYIPFRFSGGVVYFFPMPTIFTAAISTL